MNLQDHFNVQRITRFCEWPGSLVSAQRLALVRHLSADCEQCWSAVSGLAPEDSWHPSDDPVAEALHHVSTPRSRALLGADHVAAIANVRRSPSGFPLLLVEEAGSLSLSCEGEEPLEDVRKILSALTKILSVLTLPQGRQDDLQARALAYLGEVRILREEIGVASEACHQAEVHRLGGTGEERVHATVLEARASLAAAKGDPRKAEDHLSLALDRLAGHDEHALRRFELYCRLANIVSNDGDISRIPAIIAQADEALAPARESADLAIQAWAVLQRAKMVTLLAARLKYRLNLRDAVRSVAGELESAGELFAKVTDSTTQTMRRHCLVRLHTSRQLQEAAAVYREADGPLPELHDLLDADGLALVVRHLRALLN